MLVTIVLSLPFVSYAAAACRNGAPLIQRNELSCRNKQYIVDYHNKIRNHVASGGIESQPKAANMVQMRWSETLAKLAQKRADACVFEHGDLELKGQRVGQNLAIEYRSAGNLNLNITSMIELWYNEVFQYGYTEGFEPNSGHYSQLIWGTTREVGCGYTIYKSGHWYNVYFVCDYFPPGNWIGQKPYIYGKRDCKTYKLQESLKYSKLCAVDKEETTVCKEERSRDQAENQTTNYNLTDIDQGSTTTTDRPEDSSESSENREDDELVTVNFDFSLEEIDESINETMSGSGEDETVQYIRQIYNNLGILKNIISGEIQSTNNDATTETNNETTTYKADENSTEIVQKENNVSNKKSLEILNDTLKIAEKLLEKLTTNSNE